MLKMKTASSIDYSLYLVTDRKMVGGRVWIDVVMDAVAGGVTVVQLREKDIDATEFTSLATALRQRLDGYGLPLIINDNYEIAMAIGAAGVHVGQNDIPCKELRTIVGDKRIIGVSVSTIEEAMEAESEGADYLGISPVFDTPTKTDTPTATGLEGLRKIRAAVRLPLVAIGGINIGNAAAVIAAGASGLAVVSAIMAAPDPQNAARELRKRIGLALNRQAR
jgi:thiamine-phosphate pyrophosphorylase